MLTANLDAGDFSLQGTFTNTTYTPTSFSYDRTGTTLTIGYASLPDDQYALTLFSGAGQFQDALGRDLDGEAIAWPIPPNESGDGVEGGNFVVHFYENTVGATPFPTPLTSVAPSGSLIYSGSASTTNIAAGSDTDSFTISLDAGQTITALVHPASGLQPTIQLCDPSGTVLATASSAAAGTDALIQTIPVASAGLYTITVASVGSTVGSYTAQVYLNTALETEGHNGPTNDTAATAQDISGSFVSLGGAASRGAVLGTTDSSTGDYYSFSLGAGDSISVGVAGLTAGALHVSLTDASGTVLAVGAAGATNLAETISDFAVAAGGTYEVLIYGDAGVNYSLVVTRNASFDTEPNDLLTTPQPVQAARVSGQQTVLGCVEPPTVTTVEPDNYAAGTTLTNIVPGVTLTVLGNATSVTSQTSSYKSTGTRVFAHGTSTAFSNTIFLKAAFATPVYSVSIDLVADDTNDPGFLKAYSSSGVLLQDLETGAPRIRRRAT